jgi:mono/diheme cytochrome c family protein
MKRGTAIFLTALLLVAIAAIAIILTLLRRGVSAHDEPTHVEAMMARTIRHYAIPAEQRAKKNPLPLTPAVLAEARAHFADHCATCHANDGKGQSALGRQMYPRTPDMTLAATQSLSDGELFAIIENGVRLTGMPAFGDGSTESVRGSWALVHFIRHLPKLTPEELSEMEQLNPKTPEEWKQFEEEANFLKGH